MADKGANIQRELKLTETRRSATLASAKTLADIIRGAAGQAALRTVETVESACRSATDEVAAAIKTGDTDAARAALSDPGMRTVQAAWLAALVKLDGQQRIAIDAASQQAAAGYTASRNLLLATTLVAVSRPPLPMWRAP